MNDFDTITSSRAYQLIGALGHAVVEAHGAGCTGLDDPRAVQVNALSCEIERELAATVGTVPGERKSWDELVEMYVDDEEAELRAQLPGGADLYDRLGALIDAYEESEDPHAAAAAEALGRVAGALLTEAERRQRSAQ